MPKIHLSGKHSDKFALVSDEDFEKVSIYKWYLVKGYAQTSKPGEYLKMHRFIVGALPGQIVDHRDRIRLNNQRENLRIVSSGVNAHNRSGKKQNRKRLYFGVEYISSRKIFRAVITRNGNKTISESYKTELAAAIRFNRMIVENNFESIKNNFSLTEGQQLEILQRDLVPKKEADLKSGIIGINYRKRDNTWDIRKNINGKRIHIGCAKQLDEAIVFLEAYNNHI